jgi:hypothetical protein
MRSAINAPARAKKSAAARRSNRLIRFKQDRYTQLQTALFPQYFNKNRKKARDRSLGGR